MVQRSRFWDPRHARKVFRLYPIIYSHQFSITYARQLIELRMTLWILSKVGLSRTFVIASSISSLEVHSRSLKTWLPSTFQKTKIRKNLYLANRIRAIIVKHDASRILMSLLIHCDTLNCPHVPKKSPAGSDDENSRFPFSNREKCNRQNIISWICFLCVRCRAWLVCCQWRKSLSRFFGPDGLLRPWNDICRRSCKHFWGRIGIGVLEPGLVTCWDSFKMVLSRLV
jgi:hypothetical protein